MIVSAALSRRGRGAIQIIFSTPAPGRHHDILHSVATVYGVEPCDGGRFLQGFLTDKGEFLNREDAAIHARECGQIGEVKRTNPQFALFSEDLW